MLCGDGALTGQFLGTIHRLNLLGLSQPDEFASLGLVGRTRTVSIWRQILSGQTRIDDPVGLRPFEVPSLRQIRLEGSVLEPVEAPELDLVEGIAHLDKGGKSLGDDGLAVAQGKLLIGRQWCRIGRLRLKRRDNRREVGHAALNGHGNQFNLVGLGHHKGEGSSGLRGGNHNFRRGCGCECLRRGGDRGIKHMCFIRGFGLTRCTRRRGY